MVDPKEHWEHVYTTRRETDVSWYQAEPRLSLDIIRRVVPDPETRIADVGGGASRLVDELLKAGYRNLTVLDISPAALAQSQQRLGALAGQIKWIAGNALDPLLPASSVDFWHDRAVFHFLVDPPDRSRYIQQVRRAVQPRGHILVATFAEDGPQKCSGLPVARYSESALIAQFGEGFELLDTRREDHMTPARVHQSFLYCLLLYNP